MDDKRYKELFALSGFISHTDQWTKHYPIFNTHPARSFDGSFLTATVQYAVIQIQMTQLNPLCQIICVLFDTPRFVLHATIFPVKNCLTSTD